MGVMESYDGKPLDQQVSDQVRAWDAGSERSRQAELGWSQMSGCRAWMGFRLRGEWASDDDDNWRANVGTALHEWLTRLRSRHDDAGVCRLHNIATLYRGVPGHADEVDFENYDWNVAKVLRVVDYKFPSKTSAAVVRDDPEALAERMIQPHGYAAGLAGSVPGETMVGLLIMPVDGTFGDWWYHEEPFDPDIADRAVDRYEYVREAIKDDGQLPRDKPYWWCERFCEYFSRCRPEWQPDQVEEITDPELAAAVERYGLAAEQARQADRDKKLVRPLIEGLRGRARGWEVWRTRPKGTKLVLDLDRMAADYAESGMEPPMREVPSSSPALNVRRVEEKR